MEKSEDTVPSLLLGKFKVGKHKMVLPEIDCIAIAMVYKGKMYGGFVKVNFFDDNNVNNVERVFSFLVKSGKNHINKLRNK